MRIVVAAVGRLKRGPEVELAERYRERSVKSGRGIGLRSLDIIEIAESRARDAQRRMLEESIALANIIPERAATVLLDPRGETLEFKRPREAPARLERRRARRRLRDRRAGRARADALGKRDAASGLRRAHLAAPAGARDAAGADLSRDHDHERASVSSGIAHAVIPAERSESRDPDCQSNRNASVMGPRIAAYGGFRDDQHRVVHATAALATGILRGNPDTSTRMTAAEAEST